MTEKEYITLRENLFRRANSELASFGQRIADYCWELDYYANPQDWEGQPNRLIVFGVPESIRVRSNAKNYFSIFSVKDCDENKLKCEVIFPKTAEREGLIRRYDTEDKLRVSSINEVEGDFEPGEYNYLVKLINVARSLRVI